MKRNAALTWVGTLSNLVLNDLKLREENPLERYRAYLEADEDAIEVYGVIHHVKLERNGMGRENDLYDRSWTEPRFWITRVPEFTYGFGITQVKRNYVFCPNFVMTEAGELECCKIQIYRDHKQILADIQLKNNCSLEFTAAVSADPIIKGDIARVMTSWIDSELFSHPGIARLREAIHQLPTS